VLPDSFRAAPRAPGPVFTFSAPEHFSGVTEGAESRFQVLRNLTRFGRHRGRRIPFSCFALLNSFSTVARTLGPGGIFCTPGHVFGGNESVGARFHVLLSRTVFGWYQGVRSCFQILRSRTRFGRYRGHQVPFSNFALPDIVLAEPRASGTVFEFCVPGLIFDGTEGVGARFHVLRSQTLFGRYRGRRGSFSSFALPNTFLTAPRASRLVFIFCAPGLFLGGTEAVRARFHVLRSRTRFRRYGGRRGLVLMFFAPGYCLGITEAVRARFQVLRSRTRFLRYRGRRVPFSYFALPDSFWAVPRVSGIVFMFCAPGHVFGGIEGVGSHFHVLRSPTLFRQCRGRGGSISCFALPDSFWALPRASGPVSMFCAPGLVSGGTEGVGYRFQVFRSRTCFGRY
jgi:hypothetical protein